MLLPSVALGDFTEVPDQPMTQTVAASSGGTSLPFKLRRNKSDYPNVLNYTILNGAVRIAQATFTFDEVDYDFTNKTGDGYVYAKMTFTYGDSKITVATETVAGETKLPDTIKANSDGLPEEIVVPLYKVNVAKDDEKATLTVVADYRSQPGLVLALTTYADVLFMQK